MVEETQLNADGEEQKPALRRRTRRTTAKAEPEATAEANAEATPEDAPKPATRRRRTSATAEPEAADQAPPSEATKAAAAAEEAPKPRRTRRRATAEASEEAATPTTEAVSEEDAKPKRATRRRTTAKAEEPAAEESVAEQAPPASEDEPPKPKRTRRRTTAKAEPDAEPAEPVAETPAPESDEEAPKPARRRRTRRTAAEAASDEASASESAVSEPAAAQAEPEVEPEAGTETADTETASTGRRRRRSRRGGAGRRRQTAEGAVAGIPPAPEPSAPESPAFEPPKGRRRKKSEPTPDETVDVSFMHPSEREFAHLLDYYQIPYLYEPRSFPLRWDGDRVVEMFTPDFYLPEYDQYFELTTMKQSLVTQKNRKLRHVREVYPEINVQLLYRRDLMRLMGKYGYGPLAEVSVEGTERVLYSEEEVQNRVRELGQELTREYAGKDLVLIGVLRGVVVFMADLMREIDLPLQIEFMEISHYGEEREEAIDIIRDLSTSIEGRHVIVVEDIVDTGLTLRYLLEYLKAKKPASVKICAMLDKSARRMAKLPIDYVGFEIPDEFVIGYGLDYGGRYRNLKHIGVLKPIEPKAIPQR